jgi:hypothetical protein
MDFTDPLDRTGAIDRAKRKKGAKEIAPLHLFFLQRLLLFVIADRSRRLAHGTADLPPVE